MKRAATIVARTFRKNFKFGMSTIYNAFLVCRGAADLARVRTSVVLWDNIKLPLKSRHCFPLSLKKYIVVSPQVDAPKGANVLGC